MLPAPQVAFLSLAKARHPRMHRAINEWHQLDHRPENLALEGVAYGERFVRTPQLAAAAHGTGRFEDFDYATLYWLDEPAESAIDVWAAFAEQSMREGRRPDVDLIDRPYMEFFRTVGHLAAPGSRLNPRAQHFRPATGVVMIANTLPADASRSDLHRQHAWELDTVLPALAQVPGFAAGWVLHSDPSLAPSAWRTRESAGPAENTEVVRLTWILTEAEPVHAVADRIREAHAGLAVPADVRSHLQHLGAAETITPWQWSWFDAGTDGQR